MTFEFKIDSLDGNTQKLDGGAMFGNAPKEMWKNWIAVDDNNRIPLSCRCLLLTLPNGKKVLFEAGVGAFFEPKLKERYGVLESEHVLLQSLSNLGLTHEDIDFVVLSHLHFDHAGGVLSSYQENTPPYLLFPNARYFVSEKQWQRAKAPHMRDKASYIPILNELLEKSGRLSLVSDQEVEELKPYVSFHFSEGHTPGLMLAEIHLPEGPLLFASDLIPGLPWVHTSISMGYDRYPELVLDEKKSILEYLVQKKGRLFFTHDSQCDIAWVQKDTKGKFYAYK